MSEKNVILQESESKLAQLLEDNTKGLPSSLNKTRFIQESLTVLKDTKGIENCKPLSIARTIMKGAYLNLSFMNKECYAIPYGGELQFQTDYKGEIKIAKLLSIKKISEIYAKIVREDDDLLIKMVDGDAKIEFTPKPFSNKPIVGAFSICKFEDNTLQYETMSKEDVEEVRQKSSKCPNSGAWVNYFGEMCKKTVIRRMCKMIQLEFASADQTKSYQDGANSDVKGETIDTSVKDPFNATPEPQDKPSELPPPAENAVIEEKSELFHKLKDQFPNEKDWQIDIRVKEHNAVK